MKKLEELLAGLSTHPDLSIEEVDRPQQPPTEITGIAYHSAQVKPGDLFVCIRGYKTDGHNYLKDAAEKGAVAAVVEYEVDEVSLPQYRTSDSRMALALLSSAFYDDPCQKMTMIGITATNGKTTTGYMINEILEKQGKTTGLIGTVVIKADDEIIASELTTPESLDLQRHLAHMVEKNVEIVTMEVSSSALDLKRVGGITYDIAVFNNISREHIDLHGSYENYQNIKSGLIRNLSAKSYAVLNADCPQTYQLKDQTKAQALTYSVESDLGDLICENLNLSTGRAVFDVRIQRQNFPYPQPLTGQSFSISLTVPGYHSVYNAMAAIAVALIEQIPIPVIRQALSDFRGVERRFELIYEDDFMVFDDHFANAGNIDVTLGTLEKMDYRKLILIYAIRGARGPIVNRENAEAIVRWAKKLGFDTVLATKSLSHTTKKDKVSDEEVRVLESVLTEHHITLELYDEIKDACNRALDQVQRDDVILLAGCQGMDYGASVLLREIHRRHPQIDEKKLYRPLENRVCGLE